MIDGMREWLMNSLIDGHVGIIAWWDSPQDKSMHIQDFYHAGTLHYYPIFSSDAIAREQTKGTPYESKLVSIKGSLLFSMLRGDELLILDPKDGLNRQFKAFEFKALMAQRQESRTSQSS